MTIWGLGIVARLYFLQIVESKYYVERAAQHQQDVVLITPRRGDIWDRNNNLLASSSAVDSVFARPGVMKDPVAVARSLAPLTGLPLKDLLQKLDPDRSW